MTENENNNMRQELLDSISELFLKYGLRSTSMDDICSHLKISKKTLYQFFANKDDVVEQVMLYRRENHRQRQRDLHGLKRYNAIEIMWLIKQHIILDFNNRIPANLFDVKKYHPDVYQRLSEANNKFIYFLLDDLLERGVKDGYFRQDINREVQIYLFVKQMSFLGEPETISEIKYPYDIIVSTLVENIVRSLATPKGVEEFEKLVNNIKKE